MREIDATGEEGVDNEQIMVKSGLEMIDGWLYLILKCSSTQSPKGRSEYSVREGQGAEKPLKRRRKIQTKRLFIHRNFQLEHKTQICW